MFTATSVKIVEKLHLTSLVEDLSCNGLYSQCSPLEEHILPATLLKSCPDPLGLRRKLSWFLKLEVSV
ncbi:hypothetical protein QQF64_004831 [Cirrhinus molitorella]|uniref:Uncharacterized protein n=1 Tax=Cirrhinus molitorella TaxID=172907 RepID=A0ABR3MJG9_9TELE